MNDLESPTPPEETPPRKRGAPRGNLNALKHGFYSERFRTGELDALLQIPQGTIDNEITILRVITRRTVEKMEEGASAEEILGLYNIIGMMCMRISTLMRTEKLLDFGREMTTHKEEIGEHAEFIIQTIAGNKWLFPNAGNEGTENDAASA